MGRHWWAQPQTGEVDSKAIGTLESVQPSYMTRVLRLAFLSPAVIDAILAGQQKPRMTIQALTLGAGVDARWQGQKVLHLPLASSASSAAAGSEQRVFRQHGS